MIKKKIVTIVGAGVIGAGWAARMLACGLIVNAYDPSVKARKQLLSNTKTALKSLQRLGLNKNAKLSNLKIYSDLRESLHSTTFVQENAPENEKLKKKLLKDIDKLKNLDLWIVGLLRQDTHPAHAGFDQIMDFISYIKPKQTIFTHMTALLDEKELISKCPANVKPGYDGMIIDL